MSLVQEMGLELANALNAVVAAESECAKVKRMLEEEQKLVRRLKQEKDDEAQMAKRIIERMSHRLADARKDVEHATTRADVAEVKRELQEEREHAQCEDIRQSARRQVEEKELELANALNAAATAERRMLEDQKHVQGLKLKNADVAQLAKRQIEEMSQELADARKDNEYATARADFAEDNSWTVDNWFGLSVEEFSLLLGSFPGQGTTNVKPWSKSCELLETPQPNDIKWELIWKLSIPAKLISFLRKICMNHVPLGDKQTKRNLRTDGNCSFGCPVTEDLDHLFMKCPLSRAVWFGSTLKLRVENISPASIQCWVLSVLMRSQQDQTGRVRAFLEWITCVCWCIYQHRNAVIFHHQQPSPVNVLHHLSALLKELNNNIHHKPAQSPCAMTVFKASPNSQEAPEQTEEKMMTYLEEELAKTNLTTSQVAKEAGVMEGGKHDIHIQMLECEFSKAKRELEEEQGRIQRLELELEEITKNYMRKVEETRVAQRRKQEIYIQILAIVAKGRDAERIRQEEIIQIQKSECAKLKRELEEERKLVQRLKLKDDNEAQVTKRKVEEIGQQLANARKSVEDVSTRAHDAENKWITAKRELQEEQQLVQLLKLECEETRQSAKRQVEGMELQLTSTVITSIAAESRAVAAEEKLSALEKEIESSGEMACVICLTNEKDMAFGCGHMTCGDCGLIMSICPICREPITSRLRLFPG